MQIPSGLVSKKTVIPPSGGWKENTYYIVDVAFSANNPIHRKIFYTGFLNSAGNPCGYNKFGFCEDKLELKDAYFVRVIRELDLNS